MSSLTRRNDGRRKDIEPKGSVPSTGISDQVAGGVRKKRSFIVRRRYAGASLRNTVIGESKITSKGQVTIPIAIRKALDLKDGDHIMFQIRNGVTSIKKMTAIDRLARAIGPELRKEFPTPEDLDAYLRANRKKIFEKVYGDI
ncbi:MAG TPA: type II toxin-antitoxin system PrlF family antitoxin [Bacillota bacterium]|jgi:AbrB family looped-hinge helix DNA binding protein|nr:type II toxin-antitoxin system PrlF family antitoxin [Peptococcaceae bacterium MAG4]NLW38080.1 AbrB/MazE/SpoVT family DNA-binding domain-containing protein [Peptococcaceae bacterium]HPZ43159.1 type II toxin-antitoxin system PrlF family antitoxin [Bacillota bacterium]HQD75897.1 type II toxin-antitoxin system PrlF family antitoxin [Bacillota bacterium]HUM58410.1 type II toxin-antitoxin system PrlF family antitoxin [Bacillota bacterium]